MGGFRIPPMLDEHTQLELALWCTRADLINELDRNLGRQIARNLLLFC